MRKSIKQSNKGGFTLVETLVAVSVFSISLIGILSVLGSGISNTNYAKRKMTATYLAQEGIEYVRNQRDNELLFGNGNNNARWNRFKNSPDVGSELAAPADSGFSREVWIDDGASNDDVVVYSKVEWTQGSGNYNITFSASLYNWASVVTS